MAYPESIDKFIDKLNKLDDNTYVIEEVVTLTNGVYEGELEHDNVSLPSINVYTGSKLTGNKVDNVIVSTPSLTPWKRSVKIFSDISPVYISYQTTGDTVEAEDINNVQDSIVNTQTELEKYKNSNDTRVSSDEVRIVNVENNKAEKTYVDTELNKRYLKTETYTKDEMDQRIQNVVGAAPAAMDTLKEIADALGDDANFAGTMTAQLSGKVDKVTGKQLSTEDYTTTEKQKLAGVQDNANNYIHPATHPGNMITEDTTHRWTTDAEKSNWNDANSQKHTHNNFSILQTITQALIDAWNSAVDHISDTIKHITSDERTLWNTVSNKVDKIAGKSLSTNDFDNTYKTKLDGMANGATKVEDSTTNGNIKINSTENNVYTHPGSGTNPHGTTKTDIGLPNVTNDAQVKRTEMGAAAGVATLDASGVNAQTPKAHNHDDRYYTETESDNKFATKDDVSNAGYGDMLKSVYDTDNDGIVDNAEKINGVAISDIGQLSATKTWTAKQNFNAGAPVQLANNAHIADDLINTYPAGYSIFWLQNNANGFPITTSYGFIVTFNVGTSGYQEVIEMYTGTDTTVKQRRWFRTKRDGNNFWQPFQEILTSSKKCTWNDLKGV